LCSALNGGVPSFLRFPFLPGAFFFFFLLKLDSNAVELTPLQTISSPVSEDLSPQSTFFPRRRFLMEFSTLIEKADISSSPRHSSPSGGDLHFPYTILSLPSLVVFFFQMSLKSSAQDSRVFFSPLSFFEGDFFLRSSPPSRSNSARFFFPKWIHSLMRKIFLFPPFSGFGSFF